MSVSLSYGITRSNLFNYLKTKIKATNEDYDDAISEAIVRWLEMIRGGGGYFNEEWKQNRLKNTAKNWLINLLKKRKNEVHLRSYTVENSEDEIDESDLFTILEFKDFEYFDRDRKIRCCRNMIDFIHKKIKLNTYEDIIFSLHHIQGIKLTDISFYVKISPNAVVKRNGRLLEKIKSYFLKKNIKSLAYFDS